jgi:sigma-B regulation protein RsbU (phosphoserine phosphatase)
LRRRVLAIAASAGLGVTMLIGFSARIVLDVKDTLDEQRMVLLPALRAADDYETAVREQQRGERGYVITGDRKFLEPFQRGGPAAAVALADLRRFSAGDADLRRQIDEAARSHQVWVTEEARPAIAAVDRGEPDQAAATVNIIGKRRFDDFIAQLADVQLRLRNRSDTLEARLLDGEDRLLRLLVTAALAGVIVLALVLAALERWVIEPVESLREAVRRVARGGLEHSVTVVGPREVVELGGDVDAMRLRILAELEEMRRANEALEQQAPLVVGLRDVLLPTVDAPSTLAVGSLFLPAEGVLAGDWFEVWSLEDGRIGLVLADISGHGADAGLFALRLKDLLLSAVAIFPQPGEALAWVAERLGDTDERFATIFVAILDIDRGRMLYASAGHHVVLLAQPETIVSLLPTGPLLGPLRARWETRTARIGPDTVMVAYTDGLIEARSAWGEEFGAARLLEVVTRMRGRSPSEVVEAVRAELEAFGAGRFQDDVTLVAVGPATPPG